MTDMVTAIGSALLGYRVVEERTGQPAMTGRSPVDNGGIDRASSGGKLDEAAAWKLADTVNERRSTKAAQ